MHNLTDIWARSATDNCVIHDTSIVAPLCGLFQAWRIRHLDCLRALDRSDEDDTGRRGRTALLETASAAATVLKPNHDRRLSQPAVACIHVRLLGTVSSAVERRWVRGRLLLKLTTATPVVSHCQLLAVPEARRSRSRANDKTKSNA